MAAKRILVLLIAVMFILGIASLGFAADVKGTATKIDGKKITVKDAAGKETIVEVKEVPKDLKVGSKVAIKNGVVKLEGLFDKPKAMDKKGAEKKMPDDPFGKSGAGKKMPVDPLEKGGAGKKMPDDPLDKKY